MLAQLLDKGDQAAQRAAELGGPRRRLLGFAAVALGQSLGQCLADLAPGARDAIDIATRKQLSIEYQLGFNYNNGYFLRHSRRELTAMRHIRTFVQRDWNNPYDSIVGLAR